MFTLSVYLHIVGKCVFPASRGCVHHEQEIVPCQNVEKGGHGHLINNVRIRRTLELITGSCPFGNCELVTGLNNSKVAAQTKCGRWPFDRIIETWTHSRIIRECQNVEYR